MSGSPLPTPDEEVDEYGLTTTDKLIARLRATADETEDGYAALRLDDAADKIESQQEALEREKAPEVADAILREFAALKRHNKDPRTGNPRTEWPTMLNVPSDLLDRLDAYIEGKA